MWCKLVVAIGVALGLSASPATAGSEASRLMVKSTTAYELVLCF